MKQLIDKHGNHIANYDPKTKTAGIHNSECDRFIKLKRVKFTWCFDDCVLIKLSKNYAFYKFLNDSGLTVKV